MTRDPLTHPAPGDVIRYTAGGLARVLVVTRVRDGVVSYARVREDGIAGMAPPVWLDDWRLAAAGADPGSVAVLWRAP